MKYVCEMDGIMWKVMRIGWWCVKKINSVKLIMSYGIVRVAQPAAARRQGNRKKAAERGRRTIVYGFQVCESSWSFDTRSFGLQENQMEWIERPDILCWLFMCESESSLSVKSRNTLGEYEYNHNSFSSFYHT